LQPIFLSGDKHRPDKPCRGVAADFYKMLAWHMMGGLLAVIVSYCLNLDRPAVFGEMASHRETIKNRLFFTFWREGVLLSGYGEGGLEIADFSEILTG
jgi:hypothetical protein